MRIDRRSLLGGLGAMAGSGALPGLLSPAHAQQWPQKPVRTLITTGAGGSPDTVARLVGEKLSERLGQQFVVESMTGGGGNVAYRTVASSPPDASTVGLFTGALAVSAAYRSNLPIDPMKDLTYISTVCGYPLMFSVLPDSPIKSFADLLARAKKEPKSIRYTITSFGATHHVLGTWVNMVAGTDMVAVPYRGIGPTVTDFMGGRVEVLLEVATTGVPRVKDKTARALAVSSPERYPQISEVPTIAETLPGVEAMTWLGYCAGKDTPKPIVDRFNAQVREIVALPEVREKFLNSGVVPLPSTPNEFRARVERETERWRKIIEANNIQIEQ